MAPKNARASCLSTPPVRKIWVNGVVIDGAKASAMMVANAAGRSRAIRKTFSSSPHPKIPARAISLTDEAPLTRTAAAPTSSTERAKACARTRANSPSPACSMRLIYFLLGRPGY